MTIFTLIFFIGLGFIIGSFLNVVVLRFNTGKKLTGRSSCYSCATILRFYELVPVFSWLFQRGRCRTCSSKISKQYLYGELLTGFLFGLASLRGFFTSIDIFSMNYFIGTLYLCLVFSFLVVIFLYDVKHKIIPDSLSLVFAILGIVSFFFFDFAGSAFVYTGFHIPDWLNWFSLVVVPLPFFMLWFFSKGKLIGLGDPKLMVGMGAFLGINLGFSAVFISFWIGTLCFFIFYVYSLLRHGKFLLNTDKKSIMKTEIPFGPFLILGFVFTIITHISIFL